METSHLTFTRFIAAISIVIYHFGYAVFPFNERYLNVLVQQAYLGVNYFFVLSGFVMVVAYGKKKDGLNTQLYLKNRIARILPLYYLALIIMLLYYFIRVYILHVPFQFTISTLDISLYVFLLQAWFPGKALVINTAAWTLSAEGFFYLTFPFLFNKIYYKKSLKSILIFALLFFIISQISFFLLLGCYPNLYDYMIFQPFFLINEFIIGNTLGFFFLIRKEKVISYNFCIVLIFVFLSLLAEYYTFCNINLHSGLFTLLFAPLIYFIAIDKGVIKKIFNKRRLIFLGEISYGIYILQFPIYFFFTAFLSFIGFKINQPLFYLYLVLLIFFSAISFIYIEKPLRDKIKRLKKIEL